MMQNPCIFKGSLILEGVFILLNVQYHYLSIFEFESYLKFAEKSIEEAFDDFDALRDAEFDLEEVENSEFFFS